jgi:S1-C subfamily serine protease
MSSGGIVDRGRRWVVGLLLSLLAGPLAALELPDLIDRIRPSVVAVGTVQQIRRPPALFRGTGFVVGNGNQIITNAHVLPEELNSEQREYLAVFSGRGQQFEGRSAKVVAVDREHDLALLSIEGKPLPALSLDSPRPVREGQSVVFTGFPIGIVLGLYPVTHQGIVSALSPVAIPLPSAGQLNPELVKRLRQPFEVLQLDAIAYPGNSGSPLFDLESGRLLAVVNSVFIKQSKEALLQQPSGITYAIPIQYARALLAGKAESR